MNATDLPDGQIDLDSPGGKAFGFTSDRFDGYLWRTGNVITISFIVSRARGNFRALVERIQAMGFGVDVPTPFPRMRSIVERNGFVQHFEDDPMMGRVEVWSLPPKIKPSPHACREGFEGSAPSS